MDPRDNRVEANNARFAEQVGAAEIESIFRAGNEALRKAIGDNRSQREFPFLCECADQECFDEIDLTLAEYADLRSNAARFAVRHGHDRAQVEQVVGETDDYSIVEKVGAGREFAEQHRT